MSNDFVSYLRLLCKLAVLRSHEKICLWRESDSSRASVNKNVLWNNENATSTEAENEVQIKKVIAVIRLLSCSLYWKEMREVFNDRLFGSLIYWQGQRSWCGSPLKSVLCLSKRCNEQWCTSRGRMAVTVLKDIKSTRHGEGVKGIFLGREDKHK